MLIRLVTATLIVATIIAERRAHAQGSGLADTVNRRWLQWGSKALWTPPGHESRGEWLALHGTNKGVYNELLDLVKRCKVMMLRHEGYKVKKKDIDEMDIFLFGSLPTLEQVEACVELHERRHKRTLLNFKALPVYKWPMPIIYKYDGTQTAEAKKMIEAAIKHWESETCIRFQQVDTNATVTEQHLLFTSKYGCYSYTGRVPKSTAFPQQINLNSYACTRLFGIPVHEIGHAIGFWHEHVRPDRDDYVTVNMSYIYWWYRINYVKLNSSLVDTTMTVPYDYGSVMHYSATELSIGTLRSLQPTNPLYEKTMGQRVGLSFFDSKHANLAYCKDKCAGVKPFVRCYNGGYRDPNDCSKCKCPEGFGRRRCRGPAPADGGALPVDSQLRPGGWQGSVQTRRQVQLVAQGTYPTVICFVTPRVMVTSSSSSSPPLVGVAGV
ncbi:Zinc metalloproteinase nas-34 [Lamellibrachia satsuma]|nr:Zinc metalloproteinase nas-34 [Lamellibrachia satsuma]